MVRQTVIIFSKVPGKGDAKSRIAATHGREIADSIYLELLQKCSAIVKKLEYHIFFTGDTNAGDLKSIFPEAVSFTVQNGETLGTRMKNAVHTLASNYDTLCVIGTDCPSITESDITNCLELTQKNDVVIGPALDGGYYCIALSPQCSGIFDVHSWSTPHLLEDTLSHAKTLGYRVALLRKLSDIDYYCDYEQWKRSIKQE